MTACTWQGLHLPCGTVTGLDAVFNTLSSTWKNITFGCDCIHTTIYNNQNMKHNSTAAQSRCWKPGNTVTAVPQAEGHRIQEMSCFWEHRHPPEGTEKTTESLGCWGLPPIPCVSSRVEPYLVPAGSPSKSTCSYQQQIILPEHKQPRGCTAKRWPQTGQRGNFISSRVSRYPKKYYLCSGAGSAANSRHCC